MSTLRVDKWYPMTTAIWAQNTPTPSNSGKSQTGHQSMLPFLELPADSADSWNSWWCFHDVFDDFWWALFSRDSQNVPSLCWKTLQCPWFWTLPSHPSQPQRFRTRKASNSTCLEVAFTLFTHVYTCLHVDCNLNNLNNLSFLNILWKKPSVAFIDFSFCSGEALILRTKRHWLHPQPRGRTAFLARLVQRPIRPQAEPKGKGPEGMSRQKGSTVWKTDVQDYAQQGTVQIQMQVSQGFTYTCDKLKHAETLRYWNKKLDLPFFGVSEVLDLAVGPRFGDGGFKALLKVISRNAAANSFFSDSCDRGERKWKSARKYAKVIPSGYD